MIEEIVSNLNTFRIYSDMEDYAVPQSRKSKNQYKLKRKNRVYKKGGFHRTQNIKKKN